MKQHFETEEGKKLCKKVNLVYQFNLAPKKIGIGEVCYTIDLKNAKVFKGTLEGEEKLDATFSFKEDDFVKTAFGKMNPQISFMSSIYISCLIARFVSFCADMSSEDVFEHYKAVDASSCWKKDSKKTRGESSKTASMKA
ncbi:sterol carrier protein 2-like [Humulus lupulus]|uniref:sterol carrier protein 2-like n=1 Tax=Humulus lupulus TaxID=3486 RepID=UPI002B40A55F|nr:sterol carrier protein 2-like [Humulus lupulus]